MEQRCIKEQGVQQEQESGGEGRCAPCKHMKKPATTASSSHVVTGPVNSGKQGAERSLIARAKKRPLLARSLLYTASSSRAKKPPITISRKRTSGSSRQHLADSLGSGILQPSTQTRSGTDKETNSGRNGRNLEEEMVFLAKRKLGHN